MGRIVTVGAVVALAGVVGGCASSDRMARMSGGVIHEYSAPASYRLRAAKFQAKTGALGSPARAAQGGFGGIDAAPVNIWPLFFKSPDYTSFVWPLVDIDAYGFAFRPFLNVEGDDRSVLFPLSAWNVADGDGWALNFVWEKNAFGFVPLTWQASDGKEFRCHYAPFFYHRLDDWRKVGLFPLFKYEWDDAGAWSWDACAAAFSAAAHEDGSEFNLLWGLLFDFKRRVYCRDGKTVEKVSGGSFPFFHRVSGPDEDAWFSVAGLSAARYRKDGGWTAVLPFGWISKTDNRDRCQRKIYARDSKWAEERECSVSRDTWGLFGLYYHGRDSFSVAKAGVDATLVEKVRTDIEELRRADEKLRRARIEWSEQKRSAAALTPKPDDRIAYYRKMIRLEELRLEDMKLTAREMAHSNTVARLVDDAAKLGLAFDEREVGSAEAADAARVRLFDTCTEPRAREDVGVGCVYRKETFYNGDFKWRLFGILAGGEKDGTRENTHVCHLLYRTRKDGEKSETVFFPFVSIARDGRDRRFSFLGRFFQHTVRSGHSSGYLFFVPFGQD